MTAPRAFRIGVPDQTLAHIRVRHASDDLGSSTSAVLPICPRA